MRQLKPCPFCGGNAGVDTSYVFATKYRQWLIKCNSGVCLTNTNTGWYGSEEDATYAWNTRKEKSDETDR